MKLNYDGPDLQLPVREFRHPFAASVAIVGMMHHADPSFYTQVNDYVGQRESEGSRVHYEGVRGLKRSLSNEELVGYDEDQLMKAQLVRKMMNRQLSSLALAFKRLGCVPQDERIKLEEHWENHDLNIVEVANEMDEKAVVLQRISSVVSGPLGLFLAARPKAARKLLISQFHRTQRRGEGIEEDTSPEPFKEALQSYDEAIISRRNGVAIDAVANNISVRPDEHLTLLWGAGHMPGLTVGLKQMGFSLDHEFAITALFAKRP